MLYDISKGTEVYAISVYEEQERVYEYAKEIFIRYEDGVPKCTSEMRDNILYFYVDIALTEEEAITKVAYWNDLARKYNLDIKNQRGIDVKRGDKVFALLTKRLGCKGYGYSEEFFIRWDKVTPICTTTKKDSKYYDEIFFSEVAVLRRIHQLVGIELKSMAIVE